MEIFYKALGQIMRDMRNQKEYTTKDMAEKMGIASGTYRNLESGQRMPSVTQLEALGVIHNIDWFEDIVMKASSIATKEMTDEQIREKVDFIHLLFERYNDEKKKREATINDNIYSLIMTVGRQYSPNNFLNIDDVTDLGNMILNLTQTRVKQLYDKVDNNNVV